LEIYRFLKFLKELPHGGEGRARNEPPKDEILFSPFDLDLSHLLSLPIN
jgi:hypothetical protein